MRGWHGTDAGWGGLGAGSGDSQGWYEQELFRLEARIVLARTGCHAGLGGGFTERLAERGRLINWSRGLGWKTRFSGIPDWFGEGAGSAGSGSGSMRGG